MSSEHDRVIFGHDVLIIVDFTLRSVQSAIGRSHGAGGGRPGGDMARFQESPGETGIRPGCLRQAERAPRTVILERP